MKNKKGYFSPASLISTMVMLSLSFFVFSTVLETFHSMFECIPSANETITIEKPPEVIPIGSTNSFGGGGSSHFGGYDGEVKKSWKITDASVIKIEPTRVCSYGGEMMNDSSSMDSALVAIDTFINFAPFIWAIFALIIILNTLKIFRINDFG